MAFSFSIYFPIGFHGSENERTFMRAWIINSDLELLCFLFFIFFHSLFLSLPSGRGFQAALEAHFSWSFYRYEIDDMWQCIPWRISHVDFLFPNLYYITHFRCAQILIQMLTLAK